jgi:hypothetical protein
MISAEVLKAEEAKAQKKVHILQQQLLYNSAALEQAKGALAAISELRAKAEAIQDEKATKEVLT